jgi:DNA-binding NtrC family response regulator
MPKKTLREPKKVLFVEDDQDYCQSISDAMSANGEYMLTVAGTIKEATKCLKKGKFDVIIWDYCLPDGTPVKLIRATRARFPKARMIANSSSPDSNDILILAGCDIVAGSTMCIKTFLKLIYRQ